MSHYFHLCPTCGEDMMNDIPCSRCGYDYAARQQESKGDELSTDEWSEAYKAGMAGANEASDYCKDIVNGIIKEWREMKTRESEGVVVETHACYIFNLEDMSKHFKPNDRVRIVVTRIQNGDDPAYDSATSKGGGK